MLKMTEKIPPKRVTTNRTTLTITLLVQHPLQVVAYIFLLHVFVNVRLFIRLCLNDCCYNGINNCLLVKYSLVVVVVYIFIACIR